MIPKKIHYVWVGGKEPPELMRKCMASWQSLLPEYEIVRWDESKFDIASIRYVKEAYQVKKYAFVSDYIRLYALYKEGGVYMDTDVEVIKPLDSFLIHSFFSGFESDNGIPTGLMAAEKGHNWLKELLDEYETRTFILESGEYDLTTNVEKITKSALKYGLILNNSYQKLNNGSVFYPSDYFCPMDYKTREILKTKNTHTIHHFSGSWLDPRLQRFERRKRLMERWIGKFLTEKMIKTYSLLLVLKVKYLNTKD